jgi:hypothetical protein
VALIFATWMAGSCGDAQAAGSVCSPMQIRAPCAQPAPDSRLPTPDSRLPTPDSRLPTPDSRLPTAFLQPQIPAHRFRPAVQLPLLVRLHHHLFSPEKDCRRAVGPQPLPHPVAFKPRQQKAESLLLHVTQIQGRIQIRPPICPKVCVHGCNVPLNKITARKKCAEKNAPSGMIFPRWCNYSGVAGPTAK